MAKLKLASAAIIFFFCFLSLSSALASSSNIPEVNSDFASRDTRYDELIVLPSANSKQFTNLPDSESEESSAVPVNENLVAVDLTEVKEENTDGTSGSIPLKETSFRHHHRHHHRPGRSGRKEISYGNDMILSSHESFGNSGFEEDESFGEEEGGLRKFHHHHHHHKHHRFDDGEVEGVEAEKEGHSHGHRFNQRKFGGDEEHPFRHGFHHHHHHHRHHRHEEEERGEGGLLFKLRKFLNGY